MTKRKLLCLLLPVLLLLPGSAMASVMTQFNYYTMANGAALYDILYSSSAMMRSAEFKTIVTAMALLGLLVMGAKAVGDPGRHLLRVFGYAVMVAMIGRAMTSMTASVTIIDSSGTGTTGGGPSLYKVDKVPLIVAMPISFVTSLGHRATQLIEGNYQGAWGSGYSADAQISKGATFNLMGSFIQDSKKIILSDETFRRNLNAYVADCVIPAMGLGLMSVDSLTKAPKLKAELAKAASKATLTTYYSASDLRSGSVSTCQNAWTSIDSTHQAAAEALLAAPAATGLSGGSVNLPISAYVQSGIGLMGLSGSDSGGYDGKSYIMQMGLLNQMNGAFKNAAIQTGNNELMSSIALEQAEQTQKTNWQTSRLLFERLMPYTYLILQAFSLAVLPIALLMLVIPGYGLKLAVSVLQFCLWLAFWEPMFSILNYLLLLFGADQLHGPITQQAGLTMANREVVTEQANMLVLAGGFFGTMLPLVTWKLVSASMDLTAFVANGTGGQVATQAAATAASGNLSMGNVSMGNTSANKFDSVSAYSVGTSAVQSQIGSAGSAFGTLNMGGSTRMGDGVDMSEKTTHTNEEAVAKAREKSSSLSHMQQHSDQATAMKAFTHAALESMAVGASVNFQDSKGNNTTITKTDGNTWAVKVGDAETLTLTTNKTLASSARVGGEVSAEAGGTILGFGVKGKVSASQDGSRTSATTTGAGSTASKSEDLAKQKAVQDAFSALQGFQRAVASGKTNTFTTSDGSTSTKQHAISSQVVDAAQEVEKITNSYTNRYATSTSVTESAGAHGGTGVGARAKEEVANGQSAHDSNLQARIDAKGAEVDEERKKVAQQAEQQVTGDKTKALAANNQARAQGGLDAGDAKAGEAGETKKNMTTQVDAGATAQHQQVKQAQKDNDSLWKSQNKTPPSAMPTGTTGGAGNSNVAVPASKPIGKPNKGG